MEDEQELVQECKQKGLLVVSLCFNFPALHEGIYWLCLFKHQSKNRVRCQGQLFVSSEVSSAKASRAHLLQLGSMLIPERGVM